MTTGNSKFNLRGHSDSISDVVQITDDESAISTVSPRSISPLSTRGSHCSLKTPSYEVEESCILVDKDREPEITGSQHRVPQIRNSRKGFRDWCWDMCREKNFPWMSFASLCGAVGCGFGSVAVLLTSNGQDVHSWATITPAVYLAILSIISNSLLTIALVNGLAVCFWRSLVHGCTLSELNRNWQCGQSLWQAIQQGYRPGGRTTAAACILSALSFLQAPLNQRASIIRSDFPVSISGSLTASFNWDIPARFDMTNSTDTSGSTIAELTPDLISVMSNVTSKTSITLDVANCPGECNATLQGFGFRKDCNITTNTIEKDQWETQGSILFNVSSEVLTDPRQANFSNAFIVYAIFSPDQNKEDPVILTAHTCVLHTARVDYNTTIMQNRTVKLMSPDLDHVQEERYMPTDLVAAFSHALNSLFQSHVPYDPYYGPRFNSDNAFALKMLREQSPGLLPSFKDPMDILLDFTRELAFRASTKSSTSDADTQEIPYHGTRSSTIYSTDTKYMVVAILLGILGVAAIAATHWGWWEISYNRGLGPLEIAKAFDAPLLRETGNVFQYHNFPDHVKLLKVGCTNDKNASQATRHHDSQTTLTNGKDSIVKDFNKEAENDPKSPADVA